MSTLHQLFITFTKQRTQKLFNIRIEKQERGKKMIFTSKTYLLIFICFFGAIIAQADDNHQENNELISDIDDNDVEIFVTDNNNNDNNEIKDEEQVAEQAEESNDSEEVADGHDSIEKQKADKIDESSENTMSFIRIFTGKYYEGPYNTINDHLTNNVDDDANIKTNLEAAAKLLDQEKHKFFKGFKQGLIEALEQFLSLGKVLNEENKCSRRSYAILVKNDRATKGVAHKCPNVVGDLRRIDWIVHQYSLKHAIECHLVYPDNFETKRQQVDQEMLKRVELFTLNLILKKRKKVLFFFEQKKSTENPEELISAGQTIKRVKGKDLAESIFNSVKYLAKDDENVKYLERVPNDKKTKMVVDEVNMKNLLNEYIIKPCQYYVEQFGPDIFVPLKFDIDMLEKKDRYRVDKDGDFLLGWQRYRLCNTIITKDKDAMMKDVIRVAQKQKYN